MTFNCVATGVRKELDPLLERVEQQIGPVGQQLAGVGGSGVEGESQHDSLRGEQHQAKRQGKGDGQRKSRACDPESYGQPAEQAGRAVLHAGAAPAQRGGAGQAHVRR